MDDSESDTNSNAEYTKLVPIIWTVLRLMGVYMVIVGASATIQDLATTIARWQLDIGDSSETILFDYFSPQLFADVFYLAAGIYLLIGGRWIIENVFLPASSSRSPSELGVSQEDPPPTNT